MLTQPWHLKKVTHRGLGLLPRSTQWMATTFNILALWVQVKPDKRGF